MRVHFLVDGFNLYHSIKAAERRLGSGPLRWLNLDGMCSTILRSSLGPSAVPSGITYFSAFAMHLQASKPEVVTRHRRYREALEATGVLTHFAAFKRKDRRVTLDQVRIRLGPLRRRLQLNVRWIQCEVRTHEEKETDVAMACKMLELLHLDAADTIVLVTGDTDLAPAIRTARTLFPARMVCIAFPFERFNQALVPLASRHLKLGADTYARHQFPDPVIAPSGRRIAKPSSW